jgi:glucose-6-phosphate dehydrogenase assembly protein OpcA
LLDPAEVEIFCRNKHLEKFVARTLSGRQGKEKSSLSAETNGYAAAGAQKRWTMRTLGNVPSLVNGVVNLADNTMIYAP